MSKWFPAVRQSSAARVTLPLLLAIAVIALSGTACQEKLPEATLHDAIELEDFEQVSALLAEGADPDAPNAEGTPPVHLAAKLGFVDIGLALLDAGASARSVDAEGRTPLHFASNGDGMPRLVHALLERGGDVDARDRRGRTVLFSDVDRHVSRLLIGAGADVGARDDEGRTPLHVAAGQQRGGTMEVLAEHGADVNAVDHTGKTPLHIAVLDPSTFLTFSLLKNGADIEARDQDGFTPLHIAAERGHKRIVIQLLEAGASLDAKDAEGRTPLDLATAAGRDPIVRAIKARRGGDRRQRALRQLQEEAKAAHSGSGDAAPPEGAPAPAPGS